MGEENIATILPETKFELIESDKIEYVNSDSIVVYGDRNQIQEMFKDWAEYIGEIQNPDNNANNPFFKSQYAPLAEVLNTARPTLSKHGFGFFQSSTAQGKSVTVKTIVTHKSGGSISFPALTVITAKDDAQSIIAGITYARRGSLNPIAGIQGEADDDGNTITGKPNTNKPTTPQPEPDPKTTANTYTKLQLKVLDLANEKAKTIDKDAISKAMKINPRTEKDEAKLKLALDELNKLNTIEKIDLKEINN